jgi:hypothetical protein
MQPKTTLLCLFFLLPWAGNAQQVLPREVRPARPVEEPPPPGGPVPPVAPPENGKSPPAKAPNDPPANGKKTVPTAGKTTTPPDPEAAGVAPVSALNAATLLPIGVPSTDVRMPEFDEDRLISRMRVRELTRIDDDQLDLRDMDLERYLPDGSLDYVVNVERGFYALSTGRLISSAPTRLRGKAMDLHGQGCVYSKDDQVIKILGKVTSYIYVEGGRLNKSEADSPAEKKPEPPSSPTRSKS